MALIKWDPFREFDRFFEELPRVTSNLGWDLAVDVYEEKDKVVAEMNLPGIDPKNLDISVEDSYLRVSGSREEEKEQKDKEYYTKEIRRGSFERLIQLPQTVEADKADAEYTGGVLRITIPKRAEEKGNKVSVRVKE